MTGRYVELRCRLCDDSALRHRDDHARRRLDGNPTGYSTATSQSGGDRDSHEPSDDGADASGVADHSSPLGWYAAVGDESRITLTRTHFTRRCPD